MTLALPTTSSESSDAASLIRVVLADDSATIRTLVRYALGPRQGFSVVAEAANGAEALALTDLHHPDCVVLDIGMPGMDGFDVLAQMRIRCPNIPVVMLSGFTDQAVTDRAMARGAAAYLNKSGGLKDLAGTIRHVTTVASEAVSAEHRQPWDNGPHTQRA